MMIMMYQLGQHVSTWTFEVRGLPADHHLHIDGQIGQSHNHDQIDQAHNEEVDMVDRIGQSHNKEVDMADKLGQSPSHVAEMIDMCLPDGSPQLPVGSPVTCLYQT